MCRLTTRIAPLSAPWRTNVCTFARLKNHIVLGKIQKAHFKHRIHNVANFISPRDGVCRSDIVHFSFIQTSQWQKDTQYAHSIYQPLRTWSIRLVILTVVMVTNSMRKDKYATLKLDRHSFLLYHICDGHSYLIKGIKSNSILCICLVKVAPAQLASFLIWRVRSNVSQRGSVGLRSGSCASKSHSSTPKSLIYVLMDQALCTGFSGVNKYLW